MYQCVMMNVFFFLLLKNAFQVKSTDWVSLFAFSGFKSGEALSGGKIIDKWKK